MNSAYSPNVDIAFGDENSHSLEHHKLYRCYCYPTYMRKFPLPKVTEQKFVTERVALVGSERIRWRLTGLGCRAVWGQAWERPANTAGPTPKEQA